MNSPAPLNRTSVDRDATRPQETPETQDRTRNATTTANRKEAGQFTLPDLGEGLTEAEIVRWHVAVGDRVAADQVVVEVETAKAVVDVPCPLAGVVEALHGEPGDVIAVGAPLTTISGDSSPHEQHRTEERAGSGNVLVGYGTGTAARRRRQRVRPQHAVARPATGAPRVLSPIVRRLAKQHGVDLSSVDGSGPGGVILRRDVEAARLPEPERDEVRIPLRGLRGAVADKLTRSRREIPDATTWVDVDATRLLEARDELRSRGIGLLALLARFCVVGLRRFPELNSSVDTERDEIVQHSRIGLGFAAQTPRGLVVPVVRDAHEMTTAQLAEAIAHRTERARAGELEPKYLTGGTFTLNNYGVFGVDGSTPIINHPEAAILGVGRIVDKPWAHRGELALRKVTQLSLTFDHRVCDGGTAGGFLRHLADCVENPITALADV
ncbi:pyruvate dehydrogenase E2 component (dihydrolipoamide acetyltransferase) [Saccharopolyspora kobensis]|uniref:Dihydrolipoamide acetyltransferase component of pyruvate dehydrogenase complex n=3 Tax=Saccharopolyspora kobensis TaxID=146035 RepID=A0A1H5UFJ9_9PSEU|nr:pyruvate dehydrogenase E2 component (dihydrolipoamide acetyltransferase) [Saccharopolyspora kobensis]SFC73924.1 pyruvate dehydrogenase E2 component (dihydrolipoamide acetyltransferase) [Saccharopolyspora kobensis]